MRNRCKFAWKLENVMPITFVNWQLIYSSHDASPILPWPQWNCPVLPHMPPLWLSSHLGRNAPKHPETIFQTWPPSHLPQPSHIWIAIGHQTPNSHSAWPVPQPLECSLHDLPWLARTRGVLQSHVTPLGQWAKWTPPYHQWPPLLCASADHHLEGSPTSLAAM